jgi:hypothetical protein
MKQINIAPPEYKKMNFLLNEEKGHYNGTDKNLSELGFDIPLET